MKPITLLSQTSLAEYKALAENLPRYCPTTTFMTNGESFTGSEAATFILAVLATASALDLAKTRLVDARTAAATTLRTHGTKLKTIRVLARLMFSSDATALAAFGITPPKPRRRLTLDERAEQMAKARATRLARGTTRALTPRPALPRSV